MPIIKDQLPTIFHAEGHSPGEVQKVVRDVLAVYRTTLPSAYQSLLDRYDLRDAAIKVVGIGSVGTSCWVLLFMAGDSDPLFLQVKEARPSVLEPYAGKSLFSNHGQRVVNGYRLMQPSSDMFLGWSRGPRRDFFVRQLRDVKISIRVETFGASEMDLYAGWCGRALALSHARFRARLDAQRVHGQERDLRRGHRDLLDGLRRPEREGPRGPRARRPQGNREGGLREGPMKALAFLLLCALGVPSALAEDPCLDDVKRLCPGSGVTRGAVRSCLQRHETELGETCRAALDADNATARRFVREFLVACKADLDQFCPAIEPGGGRMLGCLSRNQLELSRPCESEVVRIGEARDRLEAFRNACLGDLKALCAGVPQQAGPLLECAQENRERVSAECKATDFRLVSEAAAVVEIVEDMTRRDRVREALEILQGLDSVAFSRSQILLQFDSFQSLAGRETEGACSSTPSSSSARRVNSPSRSRFR